MKNILSVILFLLIGAGTQAQVLRNLNYSHLYNPDELVSLTWDVVRENNTYKVFYDAKVTDSSKFILLTIQFETRKSLGEKNGNVVSENHMMLRNDNGHKSGILNFSADTDQTLLSAKVSIADAKKSDKLFFYHKPLPTANSFYAAINNQPVTNAYIKQNQSVTFLGSESRQLLVSFYQNAFPAAAPAFSTSQARVPKVIKPDSIFYVNPQISISLRTKGLYLAQQDTASTQGVAFRVEDDYPKLGKLESLAGPLIYVCTKQEYDKLLLAGNDKKKFDQVILSITGNTERARTFMRNYFKRVELANQYFSSYKEGWKTDRGMMYIVYGLPDEVYLFEDREVWEYKTNNVKGRFQFIKSPTVFDPDNYVLVREKRFSTSWYNTIDLWRKARF
jgi:GWxTD domain-containing protein